MLNQLEKAGNYNFFRVDGILPVGIQMRFHSKTLDELVESGSENSKFYKVFKSLATVRQGVYRCHLLDLAEKLDLKPSKVPERLYQL